MRLITDDERRARLAVRHALAPAARVDDPVTATRAMTVLHSTEPATVYLSLHARVDGVKVVRFPFRRVNGSRHAITGRAPGLRHIA